MARFAYVDGRFVPHDAGHVHIEDRGFQFADGIYEVVSVIGGRMVDSAGHLDRMERSLEAIDMPAPKSRRVLELLMQELIRLNGVRDGLVYLQITRGKAPRNHAFPKNPHPTLVLSTKKVDFLSQAKLSDGVKVITIPDIRWARCDIKTVSLLPNCMGKTQANAADAYEALQVDAKGFITEGTSSNAWIVTKDDRLLTRALSDDILRGVTRDRLIRIAADENIQVTEEAFTVNDAKSAKEAFLTSATSFLTPVVKIDETEIADGRPGVLSRRLQNWYLDYCAGLRGTA